MCGIDVREMRNGRRERPEAGEASGTARNVRHGQQADPRRGQPLLIDPWTTVDDVVAGFGSLSMPDRADLRDAILAHNQRLFDERGCLVEGVAQELYIPTAEESAEVVAGLGHRTRAGAPAEDVAGAPSTDTHAARVRSSSSIGPRAMVGLTSSRDALYGELALLSGRDPTGFELDALSISGQFGRQTEVQAAVARLGGSSDVGDRSLTIDILGLRTGIGIHNVDGSTGLNVGGNATFIGIEETRQWGSNSATLGLSAGFAAEASVGLRDADDDGRIEVCGRGSGGFLTAGGCVELPFGGVEDGPGGRVGPERR
jgi:hypothetical protein